MYADGRDRGGGMGEQNVALGHGRRLVVFCFVSTDNVGFFCSVDLCFEMVLEDTDKLN